MSWISTYQLAQDARYESGFFGLYARVIRKYICGDRTNPCQPSSHTSIHPATVRRAGARYGEVAPGGWSTEPFPGIELWLAKNGLAYDVSKRGADVSQRCVGPRHLR